MHDTYGLYLDGNNIMLHGNRVGFLERGANNEWYACELGLISHANPLMFVDNIAGTGHQTREAALAAFITDASK